ncbi:MAG: GGDEF domain-containing protein, partial [Campylobacterota bacterium]|nr:GGDEF domain-containing protein [Campylobacterota bacterium]
TDINSSISTVIELFSNNPESTGILITKNSQYYGFLSAKAIINIMNENNLLQARDQNPLTKLPGNRMIEKYISQVSNCNCSHLLCYFDLDNFKAFNDVYGFRNGDRVIQLFADLLRKEFSSDVFKAHIGGDDFFAAFKSEDELNTDKLLKEISKLIDKFANSVKEFYSIDDKKKGYISTKDRDGNSKKFPLLTVSVSIVNIPKLLQNLSEESINIILSKQKKVAKNESSKIAISSML